MLRNFNIQNYKCFKNLLLEELAPVTLVGGKNCAGKSALLEALWIMYGAHNPSMLLAAQNLRGMQSFSASRLLKDLFRQYNPENEIVLTADWHEEPRERLTIRQTQRPQASPTVTEPPVSSSSPGESEQDETSTKTGTAAYPRLTMETLCEGETKYKASITTTEEGKPEIDAGAAERTPNAVWVLPRLHPDRVTERFSQLVTEGYKERLLDALHIITGRIQDVQLLKQGDTLYVQGKNQMDKWVPLNLMGQGLTKVLNICVDLVDVAGGGAILIDEFENGLHHSIQRQVWKAIGKFAQDLDAQVFATTHSYECIGEAAAAFTERGSSDFAYYRIDLMKEERTRRVQRFSHDEVNTALDMEMELRG